MPNRFARAGYRSKPEFFKEVGGAPAHLDWPNPKASQQTKKDMKVMKTLSEIIPPTDPVNRQFYDLVQKLLAFEPVQRIPVQDALQHPYLFGAGSGEV
ncbi:hypothetical protein DL96DRAFT_1783412 [Flagelloscypha sp. PMI_526]|nr:hypothetical protein DL96DRAFT_1783412 [Flagelloscypha sp. PMI_526]